MTQEDKLLLLQDLCARLPYGIKILHTGWDYDSDTDFDTVETLIGIDDRFIYAVWDKTGDREKHCLSVSNWKPYLRPMSSMTEEEKEDLLITLLGKNDTKYFQVLPDGSIDNNDAAHQDLSNFNIHWIHFDGVNASTYIDWLNKNHFDYRGLIEKGLAIKAPKGMYD